MNDKDFCAFYFFNSKFNDIVCTVLGLLMSCSICPEIIKPIWFLPVNMTSFKSELVLKYYLDAIQDFLIA